MKNDEREKKNHYDNRYLCSISTFVLTIFSTSALSSMNGWKADASMMAYVTLRPTVPALRPETKHTQCLYYKTCN